MIVPLTEENAKTMWPQMSTLFDHACNRGGVNGITSALILSRVAAGAGEAWATVNNGKITSCLAVQFPAHDLSTLSVLAFADNAGGWKKHIVWLIGLAKSRGFSSINVDGRIGWRRALQRFGFAQRGDLMILEV